ncbi:PH domain-containing protein [Streptomyces sp. TRM 70351]|uniref:PH domain-containing protein n=1 Tax=Streptomyces sp. TRM 70351 TaxID=3116552 RepID=UPI002E7C4EFA|nr:PH domain-containing protein [Streptomyces sp. TRM 70351]MEE1929855.1 PH domain-containing protein [Streptomyces sp. TRM 70351]
MAAIADRYLADDEELVHVTRQHWTEMVGEFLLLCLVWAGAGLLLLAVPADAQWRATGVWVVLGAALLATVRLWLVPLLRWRFTVYILTTKRVYKRSGFLTKRGRSIPLVRVNDVSFKANLWQRVMGYGNLTIQSASEQGVMMLRHVPDPEAFKALIYQQVDEEQRTGQEGPV